MLFRCASKKQTLFKVVKLPNCTHGPCLGGVADVGSTVAQYLPAWAAGHKQLHGGRGEEAPTLFLL